MSSVASPCAAAGAEVPCLSPRPLFMPVVSVIPGMVIPDSRDQRLLLRELGPVCNRELWLLVNPLDKHVRALAGDAMARKEETDESEL